MVQQTLAPPARTTAPSRQATTAVRRDPRSPDIPGLPGFPGGGHPRHPGHPGAGGYPLPPIPSADPYALDARQSPLEQDLLERLRRGDELAFARLYDEHWTGVHRLLARLLGDAEAAGDLAQEVFVQLFRKPPEPGGAPVRAWLSRVALHCGYNALRSDRRRRTREDAVARDPALSPIGGGEAGMADITDAANRAEERDLVRRALVRLSERHRDCLVLRSEGLSYAEIAAALGIAQGSVGTLLARAERAFKDAYLAQRGGM
jgi:RNA polymerase sigma-70 factor, ECF subfamily